METVSSCFNLYRTVQSYYRSHQIARFNAQIAAQDGPSLLRLPDDILLMIFDILQYQDQQDILEWRRIQSEPIPHDYQTPRGSYLKARQYEANKQHIEGDFLRFSTACTRLRVLAEPRLFKTINMGSSWSADRAQHALLNVQNSPSTRHHARELHLDIWSRPDKTSIAPEIRMARQLASTIPCLENLRKLSITGPSITAQALKNGMQENEMSLPSVEELLLSPHMHWLIAYCPNVRSISSNDWIEHTHAGVHRPDHAGLLIEAAGHASKLEHFSLHSGWNDCLLQQVTKHIPHIKSLALKGGEYRFETKNCCMLELLSHLKSLEKLELVPAERLMRYFHTGEKRWMWLNSKYWEDEITSNQKFITGEVFKQLDCLKVLVLGKNFEAKVVSRDGKKIDVRWQASMQQRSAAKCVEQKGSLPVDEIRELGEWKRDELGPAHRMINIEILKISCAIGTRMRMRS